MSLWGHSTVHWPTLMVGAVANPLFEISRCVSHLVPLVVRVW